MNDGSNAREISVEELWGRLHRGHTGPWYVLDVRTAQDHARWRIEGALDVPQVNVSYHEFFQDPGAALAKVPRDLGEAVVVCARGISSQPVKDALLDAGLPAVHLVGGMIAWGDLHVAIPVALEQPDAGFELWQLNRFGKGCLSYAVVANGEAAIVDPSRFTGVYERFASARGLRIVEVLETHVHADHLSGGPELARRAGARYRVVNGAGSEPAFRGVDLAPLERDTALRIGGEGGITIEAKVLRTPGHTPGSTSYLVGGRYLLSGDTVFVKGVGRPDLGGHLEEWGRELHRTLRGVLSALPEDTVVLPAHFSGASEAQPDGVVRGRLGDIRARAPEFAIEDPDEFVARVRLRMTAAPAIYAEIVKANLGLADPGAQASQWELGRNECAASAA
jgi:glyoxylase-like metal-dependent hydrolase (beta-lactamase superfamily II)